MSEAVTLAQGLSHPFSVAYAHFSATVVCSLCQEVQRTQEQADAAISVATEYGFGFPRLIAEFGQGWALMRQGQKERGLSQMRRSLATLQAMGAESAGQYQRALLAEAYGTIGQAEEGLSVLSEAFALMSQTRGYGFGAELFRLKGELTRQQSRARSPASDVPNTELLTPSTRDTEASFRQAIDIARRQSAKAWELRAVMSLSRLWQSQGKQREAHQLLSEIYGWFTEGFDTKDLQEAKALLEELT